MRNKLFNRISAALLIGAFATVLGGNSHAFAEYKYLTLTKEYGINSNIELSLEQGDRQEAKSLENRAKGLKIVKTPDYILEKQNLVAKLNGLKVVNRFTGKWDFRTKITPVKIIKGYNQAFHTGNGKIYIGSERIGQITYNDSTLLYFSDMSAIATISHETGHSVLNHGYQSTKWSNDFRAENSHVAEGDADGYALNTFDKTSEYGWYGVVKNDADIKAEARFSTGDYISQETGGKLNTPAYPSQWETVYMYDKSAKYGPSMINFDNLSQAIQDFQGRNVRTQKMKLKYENALCQLGYIYSKSHRHIDKNKLVMEHNPSTGLGKDYGSTRLVYRDPRMPNGFKVVAYFDSNADTLRKFIANDDAGRKQSITEEQDEALMQEFALLFMIDKFGVDLYNS